MQEREPRLVAACAVRFPHLATLVDATTEDISRSGAYVRTDKYLLRGDVVPLTVDLPTGTTLTLTARVAHVLPQASARALGRSPGMGFEFLGEADPVLSEFLSGLSRKGGAPSPTGPEHVTVVVAEHSAPLVDRLSKNLGPMGFVVRDAAHGAEAYAACLAEKPDVLLADVELPGLDVWTLLRMVSGHPRLAALPVMLMSNDGSDMLRLQAYRLGVQDFITKPFTEEELAIRLRRLAAPRRTRGEKVALKGHLDEITVPTLLSLLEFERKSGILVALRGATAARAFVCEGQVVRVESSHPGEPLARLLDLLGWQDGSFEFIACEVVGHDEIGLATSQVLLEHARLKDEDAREE